MPRALLVIIAVIAMAVTAAMRPADAQTTFAPAAALLEHFALHAQGPQDRSRMATLIYSYCNGVLTALPRNTPSEDRWVQEELRSGNLDRALRAGSTAEYARFQLVSRFSRCASASVVLSKTAAPLQPTLEAVSWMRLSIAFSGWESDHPKRLGLVTYDAKAGWIDPYKFLLLPSSIHIFTSRAAVEALGYSVD